MGWVTTNTIRVWLLCFWKASYKAIIPSFWLGSHCFCFKFSSERSKMNEIQNLEDSKGYIKRIYLALRAPNLPILFPKSTIITSLCTGACLKYFGENFSDLPLFSLYPQILSLYFVLSLAEFLLCCWLKIKHSKNPWKAMVYHSSHIATRADNILFTGPGMVY